MIASGRGVAALPRWLAEEYTGKMRIVAVRLGRKGIPKQIFLGMRDCDRDIPYLSAFVELARGPLTIAGARERAKQPPARPSSDRR